MTIGIATYTFDNNGDIMLDGAKYRWIVKDYEVLACKFDSLCRACIRLLLPFPFSFLIFMYIFQLEYQLKVDQYAHGQSKNAALRLLDDTLSMVQLARLNGYDRS